MRKTVTRRFWSPPGDQLPLAVGAAGSGGPGARLAFPVTDTEGEKETRRKALPRTCGAPLKLRLFLLHPLHPHLLISPQQPPAPISVAN